MKPIKFLLNGKLLMNIEDNDIITEVAKKIDTFCL